MALGALLFALMNLFVKLASTSASWASIACVRALVGAAVAFAVARARGASLAPTNPRAIFWRSFFGTISMLATFYALSSRTVSLGDTATLLNLAPAFLAVLAPFVLRERTAPSVALAITISLLGVVLVVRPTFFFGGAAAVAEGASGPGPTVTILAAVGAAFATSIAMMMLRRVGRTEDAEVIVFHFSLFAAVVNGLVALTDLRMPTARDAGMMLAGGLCAGLGQLTMTRAYALENAAKVSGMSYLSVVASAALGGVVFGERPGPTAVAGMLLVVAGGVVVTFARSRG